MVAVLVEGTLVVSWNMLLLLLKTTKARPGQP